MNEKWYAVYTRPKWEKKIAESLKIREVNNYCPLNRVERQWSDRKKIIYEPLFHSYVFVNVAEKELGDVRQVDGVINVVSWLGRPAVIKNEEIEAIRQFLNEYNYVHLEKVAVHVRDTIRVTDGPLVEKEGIVISVKSDTVKVMLPSLGYLMHAEIRKSSVKVIRGATDARLVTAC